MIADTQLSSGPVEQHAQITLVQLPHSQTRFSSSCVLALKFQTPVRGLKASTAFCVAQRFAWSHPSLFTCNQNTRACPKVKERTRQPTARTRVLPSCPVPASDDFSNFSELFLTHVRLADSLNRFVSLRIKTAFCSNPHNKALSISYCIGVYYSWGFFFCYVTISSIPKSEIYFFLCCKVLYLILVSHFFHLSRILAMCNQRISS